MGKLRFFSAILMLAFLTVGGLLLRQHYGTPDYVPPTPGTQACAWHDYAGTHLTPNGITAYVRTSGTAATPAITAFLCENGYLYSPSATWPSAAVVDNS